MIKFEPSKIDLYQLQYEKNLQLIYKQHRDFVPTTITLMNEPLEFLSSGLFK